MRFVILTISVDRLGGLPAYSICQECFTQEITDSLTVKSRRRLENQLEYGLETLDDLQVREGGKYQSDVLPASHIYTQTGGHYLL